MVMLPSKDIRKEIVEDGTGFFRLLQRVLRVTETQTKHGAKIEKQEREIELLKDAVRTLEAREEFLLARVDAALTQAAAAQSVAVGVTDIARRIGYMEGRMVRDDG